MGNYISCTLAMPVSISSIRATKVISPSGETRRLYEPTKAAELMLVYLFFPMTRLKSVVTAADMGMLFMAAKSAAKKTAKVLPEYGGDREVLQSGPAAAPRLKLDDIEEFATPEFQHRLSMCRSKKPLLETIVEEPVYLR